MFGFFFWWCFSLSSCWWLVGFSGALYSGLGGGGGFVLVGGWLVEFGGFLWLCWGRYRVSCAGVECLCSFLFLLVVVGFGSGLLSELRTWICFLFLVVGWVFGFAV